MKKTILKILKYVLIGVSVYLAVLLIEFCCIYAVLGEDTPDYYKECLKWYIGIFN